jgi:hypothetical protein
MKIILSPIASNKTTSVYVNGTTLTVDGDDIDLSIIPEGGEAMPAEGSPFVGPVTRDRVTIKYFYDAALAEDNQSIDWEDYIFEVDSGEVPCPIIWKN